MGLEENGGKRGQRDEVIVKCENRAGARDGPIFLDFLSPALMVLDFVLVEQGRSRDE